jgi:hypothetical protein
MIKKKRIKSERRRAVGSSDLLGGRFTQVQADLAAQIANDVAENIDNRDTRDELRMAVSYWNANFCEQARLRAEAESTVRIFQCAKALMDVALPPNDPS